MKKVVTLLFLLVTVVGLKAQTFARYSVSDSPGSGTPASPLYRQDYTAPMHTTKFVIPGEKKKKAGAVMTCLGGALFLGGIAMYASADPDYESTTYNSTTGTYETTTIDPKRVLGVMMMLGGTGLAVPGILIWKKGIREQEKYLAEQERALRLGTGGNGVVLAYQF